MLVHEDFHLVVTFRHCREINKAARARVQVGDRIVRHHIAQRYGRVCDQRRALRVVSEFVHHRHAQVAPGFGESTELKGNIQRTVRRHDLQRAVEGDQFQVSRRREQQRDRVRLIGRERRHRVR